MYSEDLQRMPQNGALLCACIHALGYSQSEFARVIGVTSKNTVRRWERNQLNIPEHVWDFLYLAVGEIQRLDLAKSIQRRRR